MPRDTLGQVVTFPSGPLFGINRESLRFVFSSQQLNGF